MTLTRLDGLQVCQVCEARHFDPGHHQQHHCGLPMVEPVDDSTASPVVRLAVVPPVTSEHDRTQSVVAPTIEVSSTVNVEIEVVRLRWKGRVWREIADELGLSHPQKALRMYKRFEQWCLGRTAEDVDQYVYGDNVTRLVTPADQDNDAISDRKRVGLSDVASCLWDQWFPTPPFLVHAPSCMPDGMHNGMIDLATGKVRVQPFPSGDWECPRCHHHKLRILTYTILRAFREGKATDNLSLVTQGTYQMFKNAQKREQRSRARGNGYEWLGLTQQMHESQLETRFVLLTEELIRGNDAHIYEQLLNLMDIATQSREWYTVRSHYKRMSLWRPKKQEPKATSFGVGSDVDLMNSAILEAGYTPGESVGAEPDEIKQANRKIKKVYSRLLKEKNERLKYERMVREGRGW